MEENITRFIIPKGVIITQRRLNLRLMANNKLKKSIIPPDKASMTYQHRLFLLLKGKKHH